MKLSDHEQDQLPNTTENSFDHEQDQSSTPTGISLIIDGQPVQAFREDTILAAARRQGIDIPAFCGGDPRIEPVGRCGVCVVRIKDEEKLKPACSTTVSEGMEVVTKDEGITTVRKGILDGLLSNHNAYCEPPCHYACPAGIDIPAYLAAIARGDDTECIRIVKERLPLPRIIGRVCPRPCEDACRRTQVDGEPVAICQLKRFAGDRVAADGSGLPDHVAPATGKKVAVIGSGPTGLSAAYFLALRGHTVSIFEANSEPGGMMLTGIPPYRLPREVIQEEINEILRLGVELKTGSRLGADFHLKDLKEQGFSAIYLAIGAQNGARGRIEGAEGAGVYSAVDFLAQSNAGQWQQPLGKTLVIGGGFTAMDAARSAVRLGADEVTVVYRRSREEMPAHADEVREAEGEGVRLSLLTAPLSVVHEAGELKGLVCHQMELGEPDESGRRQPHPVAGSDFMLEADTVILAIGQEVNTSGLDGSIKLTEWGTIEADPLTMSTSIEGVFAGGDCDTGPATVVEAIAAGRRAAVAIDAYVKGADPEAACGEPLSQLERQAPEFFPIAVEPRSKAMRAAMPELPHSERSGFDEVELGFTEEQARAEAERCLECRCHAASACELQRLSIRYGAGATEFKGSVGEYAAYDGAPLLALDRQRCIKCHNCVRICDEVQQQRVYEIGEEGYPVIKGKTYHDAGCVFCGQCFSACPTGAIKDLSDRGVLRRDLRQRTETTCPYCGVGCRFDVEVEGDRVVAVANKLDAPVNEGNLCVKGRYGFSFHDHPERLTRPLMRSNRSEEFREVEWEEALEYVAARLKGLRDQHGPDSLAILTSSRGLNEENYVAQKFFRTVIGTNNVDNCARVCHSPSVAGLYRAFGSGAATNPLSDIRKSDLLFVVGSNTTEAHPVAGIMIKQAVTRGAKLIVADPRRIELAGRADIWLRQKAGTNIALLNGMLNVLIAEGLTDDRFIAERTEHFDKLKEVAAQYPPETVEEITGVPAAELRSAARAFAGAGRALILYGLGVTEHKGGSFGVMCLANLAMATGNVGRPGAGIIVLRGQNNVQGSCDMGALPDYFSGYQRVLDDAARQSVEKHWGVTLDNRVGLKEPEMYRAALAGRLKGLYVIGYDPAKTQSNLNFVHAAYDSLDFAVVQDIFLTETARRAHVVLPAACYFEKEGTFTNAERRLQRVRQVISPPAGLVSDWEIICDIARRMGATGFDFASAAAIMDEVASVTPQLRGVSYERLESEELHWPVWNAEHGGSPRLHHSNFTKGLGTFHGIRYAPAAELPDEEYSLLLSTGRVLYHYCNGSMTLRTPLFELAPEELLEICPEDAGRCGLVDGGWAVVESRRGSVRVKVKVTDRSRPGSVFLSFHYDNTLTNLVTGPGEDELSLTPEYKVCAVRVKPLPEE